MTVSHTARAAATALPLATGMDRRQRAQRILRISRVVSDMDRSAAFYCGALGCHSIRREPIGEATATALGVGAARQVVLRLGRQEIALVQFDTPGRPYPADSRSNDLWFQHLAIVVGDMDAAYAHMSARSGWRRISEAGPELLPPANGAVRAFKFRDPDGHPLELLWFPPGQGRPAWQHSGSASPFLGIDHSALSVASTPDSLVFYRALGLTVGGSSLNDGPAQARMDAVPGARVQVTSLRPDAPDSAGLELLGYCPPGRRAGATRANDVVTDWVTLAVGPSCGAPPRALQDPDGHRLVLIDQDTIDQDTIDQDTIDRGVIDQDTIDRGVIDRGAIDQGVIDRGVIDQGVGAIVSPA